MRNTLTSMWKRFKFYDYWILTKEEQKRFRNYHLPIFECPSCGNFKNADGAVNILWHACVSCGDTESLEELETSSFRQFQKWNFAFKLDMSRRDHQEVIKHFRSYILWQCNHCQRQNFNLPKDTKGNPDTQAHTNCEGCWDSYEAHEDFLSFHAMRWFWFDDGDDSDNSYELQKLAEGQFLWLKSIAKARKIDRKKWTGLNDELQALSSELERAKSRSRRIAWWRLRDGQRLIEFLEDYLEDDASISFQRKARKVTRKVSKRVRNYAHEVSATNSTYKTTPHHKDSSVLEKYFYNLSRLDFATAWWTTFWAFVSFVSLSAIIEWNWERDIIWSSHTAHLERQDKWTLDLQYRFSRREPSYDTDYDWDDLEEGIEYETIRDSTWKDRFDTYRENEDFYRLELIWRVQEVSNWSETLDTWRNELVWVPKICPSSDDTSFGGWGISPSSWWSSWVGYDGNGWLFYKPEAEEFLPDWYIDVTSLEPSIGEQIWSVTSEVGAALIWVQPAYAAWCGDWKNRDVTVEAERFVTIQRYSVWDWDTKSWYQTELIPWTDFRETFSRLEEEILTDRDNQRITSNRLTMQIEAQDQNGELFTIPVTDREQWIEISTNMWESCTIEKSYLMKWIRWVTANDISDQCIQ